MKIINDGIPKDTTKHQCEKCECVFLYGCKDIEFRETKKEDWQFCFGGAPIIDTFIVKTSFVKCPWCGHTIDLESTYKFKSRDVFRP